MRSCLASGDHGPSVISQHVGLGKSFVHNSLSVSASSSARQREIQACQLKKPLGMAHSPRHPEGLGLEKLSRIAHDALAAS